MTAQFLPPTKAVAFLLSAALAACGGRSRIHGDPLPEGAKNPIEVEFEDLTVVAAIDIAAAVISDFPITPRQVDRNRGYLETRWVDVTRYVKFVGAYPERELIAQFQFRVTEERDQVRKLTLSAVYRPNDPTRDRLVPRDHPGYTMALRMAKKFRARVVRAGGRLVEDEI